MRAPHRVCFAAAAVVWSASALAWAAQLMGAVAVPVGLQVWPTVLHALVFSLGAMPLFIAGFLFTAGPKWLRVAPPAVARLAPAVCVVLAGWLLAIGSAPVSVTGVAAGLLACAGGWSVLLFRLGALYFDARPGRRLHFGLAAGSCALTTVCLWAASVVTLVAAMHPVILPDEAASTVRGLARAGLWLGVLPVFVVATDRMLPFLDHGLPVVLERRWPRAMFWLLLSAVWAGGAAVLLRLPAAAPIGIARWAALPVVDWILAADAALVAVVSARSLHHWRRHRAARGPMVAALLRSFGWWVLAWAAIAAATMPALAPAWRAALSGMALHALGLGYLGGTMLAMVTRVTAVQAGRSTAIDAGARLLERVLHACVFVRVLASLLPLVGLSARPVLQVAALAWALVAIAWTLRNARRLAAQPVAPFPSRGAHHARRADSSGLHMAPVDR